MLVPEQQPALSQDRRGATIRRKVGGASGASGEADRQKGAPLRGPGNWLSTYSNIGSLNKLRFILALVGWQVQMLSIDSECPEPLRILRYETLHEPVLKLWFGKCHSELCFQVG